VKKVNSLEQSMLWRNVCISAMVSIRPNH